MKTFKVNNLGLLFIKKTLEEKTFNYKTEISELQPWVDKLEEKKDSGSTLGVEMSARHTKSKHPEYLDLDDNHFDVEVLNEN